jgi:hypothetical protein
MRLSLIPGNRQRPKMVRLLIAVNGSGTTAHGNLSKADVYWIAASAEVAMSVKL